MLPQSAPKPLGSQAAGSRSAPCRMPGWWRGAEDTQPGRRRENQAGPRDRGVPSRCRMASRGPREEHGHLGLLSTAGPGAPAVPATEAAGGTTACPVPGRSSSLSTPPSPLRSRRPRVRARPRKEDAAGACPAGHGLSCCPSLASPAAPPRPTIIRSAYAPRPLHQSPPTTPCAFSQSRSEERSRPDTLLKNHAPAALGEGHASAQLSANGRGRSHGAPRCTLGDVVRPRPSEPWACAAASFRAHGHGCRCSCLAPAPRSSHRACGGKQPLPSIVSLRETRMVPLGRVCPHPGAPAAVPVLQPQAPGPGPAPLT